MAHEESDYIAHRDLTTQRAWDVHKNINDVMSQRISYGMVAQSMLLLSYVTIFAGDKIGWGSSLVLEMTFSILGIFYSIFQAERTWIAGLRIRRIEEDYLLRSDPVFKTAQDAYSPRLFDLRIRQYHIAIGFLLSWATLLATTLITHTM